MDDNGSRRNEPLMVRDRALGPAGPGAYRFSPRSARARFTAVVTVLLCAIALALVAAYTYR